MPVRWLAWSAALVVGIAAGLGIAAALQTSNQASPTIPTIPQQQNPKLDRGTPLNTVAPAFALTDQFGKKVSLGSLRGKVVVLSFNDPECTTICPLATTAMLEAKKLLGPAAANVALVGIGANPDATDVKYVRAYSQAHGMMDKWSFLTGSLPEMKKVWQNYGILAQVVQGMVDHTPATFVINPQGRETRLLFTQMAYSTVPQLAVVLARAIAADMPGHLHAQSSTSLAAIPTISPKQRVRLNLAKVNGSIPIGPGNGPHLFLFFNSWDPDIATHLKDLTVYAGLDSVAPIVAIDELNVEPSPKAFREFVSHLEVEYWLAVDPNGRVADGYGVQDSPWLTLVSGSGKILWRYDVATEGWPSLHTLVNRVHAALGVAPG